MLTFIERMFKFAWNDFSRNLGSNLVAVFIMVLVISLISSIFLFQGMGQFLISEIQGGIDMSVYFKEKATKEEILNIQQELLNSSSGIKNINYISKEEALQSFIAEHKDNPVFMKALQEVGDNPFPASLAIKTENPQQYEGISKFLKQDKFENLIEEIDYFQKKPVIQKISSLTSSIKKIGIGVSAFFTLIAILVIFNAIKLAIYSSREEISTMKLVGASNGFVRGPFLIQGAVYGLLAAFLSLLFFSILTYFSAPRLEEILLGFNIFNYFLSNFWIFLGLQIAGGVGFGVISSWIVTYKHLKA